ncbi:MAG: fructosamine kinase family protein [Chloroflexota bacterium]|jgi:fructosamine-3-kinase
MSPGTPDLQPNLDFSTDQAERILGAWLGRRVACVGMQRLKGGLVNTVIRLDLDQPPHRAVVKLHDGGGEAFAAEARALEYLRSETTCPVPRVYLEDGTGRLVPYAFLLIEHLPGQCLDGLAMEPSDRADLQRQLADVLVELHAHKGERWGGLDEPEGPATWAELFVSRLTEVRTHPMVDARLDPEVLRQVDDAIEAAPSLLVDAGTPTLIHGDVWEGNLLVQRHADRWRLTGLLDPTAQFADVEYELAYLQVFDVQRDDFFTAYQAHHSLRAGYEQRRLVYWLHTALVHVALFGDRFFSDFTARTAASIGRLVAA